MTRCSAKTIKGTRCKKTASHDGKCLLHTELHIEETTSEVTVPTFKCEHTGCCLTTEVCCKCSDKRPETTTYYKYVDTVGDMPIGSRDDGYCPACKRSNKHENLSEVKTSSSFNDLVHRVSILSRSDITTLLQCVFELKRIREEEDRLRNDKTQR